MNFVSVPVALMGSVCLYVGFYHLWMYIRRKTEIENFLFATTSLSIALYDFFCVGLYNSQSLVEGMFWQRLQFASLDLFSISIWWFVYHFTKQKNRKVFIYISIWMFLLFLFGLFIRGELTLSLNNPMPKHILIGNLIDITYYEVDPGLIYIIQYITMMAGSTYLLFLVTKFYLNVNRKQARPLLISLVLFFFAAINDVLVGAAVYSFIYLIEYVYLIIILSMAYILLNKFVDLHNEVEDLNKNLEKKVVQRTQELQAALDKLETSNEELVKTQDALWGEMELAKKIQTALLPKQPTISGYEISAFMAPADEVGGDYYDVINIDGKDWMVIGDVSGHGVPAGLIMMMAQTAIHSVLRKSSDLSASELLSTVNSVISYNIKKLGESKYMTMTVLACHENGKFYFSGLHQDIMIYRANSGKVDIVETNGMWIGLTDVISDMIQVDHLNLETGDVMLLYTDGITEAFKNNHSKNEKHYKKQMFSDEKLLQVFNELGKKSTEDIKTGIMNALQNYTCHDDITMVVTKRIS